VNQFVLLNSEALSWDDDRVVAKVECSTYQDQNIDDLSPGWKHDIRENKFKFDRRKMSLVSNYRFCSPPLFIWRI
jgi:hypothetical protein